MGRYCAYLRKSRADEVREKVEAGYDALAHHRRMLVELSERMGEPIARWYSDGIKSGESIEGREGMTSLLSDVEGGMWDGVLVVEVERLTRGDMVDQGTIMRAFAAAETLIVTPHKVYDPRDEVDADYLEFGMFMSRREFKTINKRLIAGRVAAVKDGQYIASYSPYGYDKVRVDGKHTLVPNDQARFVERMFEMYADGTSYRDMASKLEAMGAPTVKGGRWNPSVVRRIVANPVYIGKVYWNATRQEVYRENGRVRYRTTRNPDMIVADGLHEPIIPMELWDRAKARTDAAPVRGAYETRNHYGRILVCAECGRALVWQASSHPNGKDILKHRKKHNGMCPVKGCSVEAMDAAVANALETVARNLELSVEGGPKTDGRRTAQDCRAEAERAKRAISDNFDRMERGVISEADFVERRKVLEERARASIAEAERLESQDAVAVIQRAANVRECVRVIRDPAICAEDKRRVVWALIDRIKYRNLGAVGEDDIELEIFLR